MLHGAASDCQRELQLNQLSHHQHTRALRSACRVHQQHPVQRSTSKDRQHRRIAAAALKPPKPTRKRQQKRIDSSHAGCPCTVWITMVCQSKPGSGSITTCAHKIYAGTSATDKSQQQSTAPVQNTCVAWLAVHHVPNTHVSNLAHHI